MKVSLISLCTAALFLSMTVGCGEDFTDVKIPLNIPIADNREIHLGDAASCNDECIKFANNIENTTTTKKVQQAFPEDGIEVKLKEEFVREYPDYKGYIDSVRAIAIDSFTYSVQGNTLKTKSPEISLYVGKKSVADYKNAHKLVTLPSVNAGENISNQTVTVAKEEKSKTGKILVEDSFKVFPVYTQEVSADPSKLSGSASVTASARVIVTVNLSDLASEGIRHGLKALGIKY